MTLIETTYQSLKQAKLTTTREAFSRDFVKRSRSWYSYTTHVHRDFSVAAAIDCLRSIHEIQAQGDELTPYQQQTLTSVENKLKTLLSARHFIADVRNQ